MTQNAINLRNQGLAYFNGVGTFSGVDGSTAGKVLRSNGTGVAPSFQTPATGAGALVLLETQNPSNASSVTFANISNSYNNFLLMITVLDVSGGFPSLLYFIQFSPNNGEAYVNSSADTTFMPVITNANNMILNGTGTVNIYNLTSTPSSVPVMINSISSVIDRLSGSCNCFVNGGVFPKSSPIDTIYFAPQGLLGLTGTLSLYGYIQ